MPTSGEGGVAHGGEEATAAEAIFNHGGFSESEVDAIIQVVSTQLEEEEKKEMEDSRTAPQQQEEEAFTVNEEAEVHRPEVPSRAQETPVVVESAPQDVEMKNNANVADQHTATTETPKDEEKAREEEEEEEEEETARFSFAREDTAAPAEEEIVATTTTTSTTQSPPSQQREAVNTEVHPEDPMDMADEEQHEQQPPAQVQALPLAEFMDTIDDHDNNNNKAMEAEHTETTTTTTTTTPPTDTPKDEEEGERRPFDDNTTHFVSTPPHTQPSPTTEQH